MIRKLPLYTKIIYGSADLGFSLTSTIIGAYFLFFLINVVGVSGTTAGLAILAGRTWDYINDPLIGHLSDRTRSRWGRRRPFLLFGALPFALAFIMMWYKPPFSSQAVLILYYAFAYVFYDTAATFVYMPYFALTPELTDDYDERTSVMSYRAFFSIVGSLIAFIVPLMIIGSLIPENADRVLLMAVIFGLFSALPLLLVFFTVREREEFSRQEKPQLTDSFKAFLKNRPFIFAAIVYLVTWVCIDLLQGILLFYIKHVLEREAMSDLIMALIFVTAVLVLPFWVWVSRRTDKRKSYAIGTAFLAAVLLALTAVTTNVPFGIVIVLCILAGVGVSAAHVLPWSLLPDAVEYDEYQTGNRHEGMFFSLVTLAQKIASSITIPLIGVLLDVTGYVSNAAVQPASAVNSIRLLVGPIPGVFLMIGIIFALKFPIDRDEFARIISTLKQRREEASLGKA